MVTTTGRLIVSPILRGTATTVAPSNDGQIAIYREAAGGSSFNSTSAVDYTFDTSVRQDSIYSIGGDSATVTVSDAGHYLVAYNNLFTVAGTGRAEVRGNLTATGTNSIYGRSSAYLRNSEVFQGAQTAATILNLSASSTIALNFTRTDNSAATVTDNANSNGLQIIKLDDNWKYARLRKTTAQNLTAPVTPLGVGDGIADSFAISDAITWDTQDELDASFSQSGANVTVEMGLYFVAYSLQTLNNATGTNAQIRRTVDSGVSVNGTLVEGIAHGSAYNRGAATDNTVNAVASGYGFVRVPSGGGSINVWASDACFTTGSQQITEAAITIVQLPSSASLYESFSTVDQASTSGLVTLPNNTNSSDVTQTDNDTATVQNTGDYFAASSAFVTRTALTANRKFPTLTPLVNGADVDYGTHGEYNRGMFTTTQGTAVSGSSCGSILELTANDTLEIDLNDLSTVTQDSTILEGGNASVQVLRLDTLFAGVPPEAQVTGEATVNAETIANKTGVAAATGDATAAAETSTDKEATATATGNVTVDAELTTAKEVDAQAQGDVTANAEVAAGRDINVDVQADATVDGNSITVKVIDVSVTSGVTASAEADATATGEVQVTGAATADGETAVNRTGNVAEQGDATVAAETNTQKIINVSVTAGITALGEVDVTNPLDVVVTAPATVDGETATTKTVDVSVTSGVTSLGIVTAGAGINVTGEASVGGQVATRKQVATTATSAATVTAETDAVKIASASVTSQATVDGETSINAERDINVTATVTANGETAVAKVMDVQVTSEATVTADVQVIIGGSEVPAIDAGDLVALDYEFDVVTVDFEFDVVTLR